MKKVIASLAVAGVLGVGAMAMGPMNNGAGMGMGNPDCPRMNTDNAPMANKMGKMGKTKQGGMMGMNGGCAMIFGKLNLSSEQEEKIDKIQTKFGEKMGKFQKKIMPVDFIGEKGLDKAAFVKAKTETAHEKAMAKAQMFEEMMAVLDEKQKIKALEYIKAMKILRD